MPICAAMGCGFRTDKRKTGRQIYHEAKQGKRVTFHMFPKDPKMKEKWILALNKGEWSPGSYSTICSRHFQPSDFVKKGYSINVLKKDAVPYCGKKLKDKSKKKKVKEEVDPLSSDKKEDGFVDPTQFDDSDSCDTELINPALFLCETEFGKAEDDGSVQNSDKNQGETELSSLKLKLKNLQQKVNYRGKVIVELIGMLQGLKDKNLLAKEQLDELSRIVSELCKDEETNR